MPRLYAAIATPMRSITQSRLRVAVIASGKDYQEAAAWAAATYARQTVRPGSVCVLLPRRERLVPLLGRHARQFGFKLRRFPFRQIGQAKFTSQLKCQAFWFAVSQAGDDELLFLVDADTFCRKPLVIPRRMEEEILAGKIGLAPDIEDRHFSNPADPWYLAPEERTVYVNSGVILASRAGLPMFAMFRALSRQPPFLEGPFNDQKVINFAMGKYFRQKLLLLGRAFNAIGQGASRSFIIGHCAGGAGMLGTHPRKQAHLQRCARLLEGGFTNAPTPREALEKETSLSGNRGAK